MIKHEIGLENTYGSVTIYEDKEHFYIELDDVIGSKKVEISFDLYSLLFTELCKEEV